MVNITNNINQMTVTAGVFREIYASQGWHLIDDVAQSPNPSQDDANDLTNHGADKQDDLETTEVHTGTPDNTDDVDNEDEAVEEEQEDETPGDEESEDEDLSEKPISEMSYPELVKYAKTLGINASGMRSKQEIREAIKNR
jgi:cbb3-type cytochrome oxidase cytochrome c subunit